SYELVDNFLQPPLRKKSLAQQYNEKQINKLLDGFLKLLDVCGVAKDALLQAKEITQQLQSILRRRKCDETGFTYETKEYLALSNKAKKLRNKSLKACKCGFALLESDVEAAFSMLGEVQGVAFTVFESLCSHINGTEIESKLTNWSLLSKVMCSKTHNTRGRSSGNQ
ncbi:hypothetical protein Godav_028816, partial [Gossypium davidsonii]|nr:hypothetical protein [Gossypium davidsonii]